MSDGGPAFPTGNPEPIHGILEEGMALRDFFAGLALCGMLSDSRYMARYDPLTISDAAEHAYELADAMLRRRGQYE